MILIALRANLFDGRVVICFLAVMNAPDKALFKAMAQNDRGALNELYAGTSAKVFGYLIKFVGNREVAAKALKNVYLRLWAQRSELERFDGQGSDLLLSLARREALDHAYQIRALDGAVDERVKSEIFNHLQACGRERVDRTLRIEKIGTTPDYQLTTRKPAELRQAVEQWKREGDD